MHIKIQKSNMSEAETNCQELFISLFLKQK